MKNFTEKEKDFLQNNVVGRTSEELTQLFNKTFDKKVNCSTIINFKKKYKLKSGIDTKFKKNQQAHNYKNIGSEFVNSEGYTLIKTGNPNTWELKHRYLYKKYKGEIPTDHSVIFADSNKSNFDLDNLILIEVRNKLVMKNKHLFFENKESTECGITIAKITNRISDLKRR